MKGSTVFVAGAIFALAIGHAVDASHSSYDESLNEIVTACDEDGPEAAAKALLRIAQENADGNTAREIIMRVLLLSGLSKVSPECERRIGGNY